MHEIKVYDSDKRRVQALWQWDREVILYITESAITQAFDVHFFTDKSKMAYVVHSTYDNGTLAVKIPNVLLRDSRPIIGAIFTMDGEEGRIEYYFVIVIRRRPQPTDYIQIGSADTQDYVSISDLRIDCAAFAEEASILADNSEVSAIKSESYAVGGTGTRDGEDTNNAKYYAEQADASKIATLASEQNAKDSENNAHTAAAASSDFADASAQSAAASLDSKNAAALSEQNAKASENTAKDHMDAAGVSEENAAESEANALAHKNAAALSEQNAKASELAAKQSEETVLGTIDEASENATLSESWAVGGTETRTGEDTNNAQYFAGQSRQHSDTAEAYEIQAKSYAVGGTGTRDGEDTDNAEYYYTELQKLMGNLSFATVDEVKAHLGF